MNEDFLHYVWKFKKFDFKDLATEAGEPVIIKDVGQHNKDAGPDFFNARVQIGETTWAGNVEIHTKSSEWYKHNHHKDKAFQNLVLHVVYEHDRSLPEEQRTATLALKDKIAPSVRENYLQLMHSNQWIPCQPHIKNVERIHVTSWMERLLVERLERKTDAILRSLAKNKNNWESTFYQFLARAFGLKVNAEPFELLAKSLPLKILAKHKQNLLQLEALFFGQAGLLQSSFEDTYPAKLRKEFNFLRQKYQLTPVEPHLWKFSRLRPSNFPTVRLAQFAQLVYKSSHLFSKILEIESPKRLQKLFGVTASKYWNTHYRFDTFSKKRQKRVGMNRRQLILINTVAPFLFIYGKHKGNQVYQDRALQLLSHLPPERNAIIKKWKRLEMPVESAFDTQALLQLKNEYCAKKRCLECTIGNKLLDRKKK